MRKLTSAAFGSLAFAILAPLGSVASAEAEAKLTISLSPSSDTGVSSHDRITNDRTPTLIGTAPPGSTVGIATNITIDKFIAKTVARDDGHWSVTLPEQSGGETRYYVAQAGQLRTDYISIDIYPFAEKPEISLSSDVDVIDGSDNITTDTTIIIDGDNGFSDIISSVYIYDENRSIATKSVDGYYWTAVLPHLKPGTHKFRATVVDIAGNTSEPSEPLVVVIAPKPHVLSLDRVRGDAGFTITGTSSSGTRPGPAGDVNGDGIEDLLLPGAVIFGSKERRASVLPLKSLNGKNGFTFTPCYGSYGATAIGDFNGDGFDDIGIGCESEDGGRLQYAGGAYVIFGHSAPFAETVQLTRLDEGAGFRIAGSQRLGRLGASVSGGDVNGDGFDDFLIGAPGEAPAAGPRRAGTVYVLFGKADGFPAELSAATLAAPDGFRINGVKHNQMLGSAIAAGADLNADSANDIILGPSADSLSHADRLAYVMLGARTAFPSVIAASALGGTKGFRVGGLPRTHDFGFRVSVGGDVNGDGIDDALFGAQYTNSYAYVILGRRHTFPSYVNVSKLSGSDGFSVVAPTEDGLLSDDMAIVGDLNGDGAAELAMGLPSTSFDDDLYWPTGSAIVAYGQKSTRIRELDLFILPANKGFRIDGAEEGDDAGLCVAGVGDINGDGFGDMAICSTFGRRNIGTVTILYGGRNR